MYSDIVVRFAHRLFACTHYTFAGLLENLAVPSGTFPRPHVAHPHKSVLARFHTAAAKRFVPKSVAGAQNFLVPVAATRPGGTKSADQCNAHQKTSGVAYRNAL